MNINIIILTIFSSFIIQYYMTIVIVDSLLYTLLLLHIQK